MENFRKLRAKYYEPLVETLGLKVGRCEEEQLFGIVEAVGGNTCIRFEHDRGLCHFSVFAASDPNKLWSVSTVATLFPRIRAMPGGEQRLTLEEQAELLKTRWPELDLLFSPDQCSQTATKLQAEVNKHLARMGMKPANHGVEGDAAKPGASR